MGYRAKSTGWHRLKRTPELRHNFGAAVTMKPVEGSTTIPSEARRRNEPYPALFVGTRVGDWSDCVLASEGTMDWFDAASSIA